MPVGDMPPLHVDHSARRDVLRPRGRVCSSAGGTIELSARALSHSGRAASRRRPRRGRCAHARHEPTGRIRSASSPRTAALDEVDPSLRWRPRRPSTTSRIPRAARCASQEDGEGRRGTSRARRKVTTPEASVCARKRHVKRGRAIFFLRPTSRSEPRRAVVRRPSRASSGRGSRRAPAGPAGKKRAQRAALGCLAPARNVPAATARPARKDEQGDPGAHDAGITPDSERCAHQAWAPGGRATRPSGLPRRCGRSHRGLPRRP